MARSIPIRFELRAGAVTAAPLAIAVGLFGIVAPILVQPTVGLISDYSVTRWGRRKPYIVAGTLLDIVFLVGIAVGVVFLVASGAALLAVDPRRRET